MPRIAKWRTDNIEDQQQQTLPAEMSEDAVSIEGTAGVSSAVPSRHAARSDVNAPMLRSKTQTQQGSSKVAPAEGHAIDFNKIELTVDQASKGALRAKIPPQSILDSIKNLQRPVYSNGAKLDSLQPKRRSNHATYGSVNRVAGDQIEKTTNAIPQFGQLSGFTRANNVDAQHMSAKGDAELLQPQTLLHDVGFNRTLKELQPQPTKETNDTNQRLQYADFAANHNRIQLRQDSAEDQEYIQPKAIAQAAQTRTDNRAMLTKTGMHKEELRPYPAQRISGLTTTRNRSAWRQPEEQANRISPQYLSATAISASSFSLQRGVWSSITGVVKRGWGWISSQIIGPLKRLAAQGWNAVKAIGSQIARAYQQANPTLRDLFNPEHLIFRTVRNLRRNLFAKALQEERRQRAQDATEHPSANAPVNEPSQLEKLNGLMETFESGADAVFNIRTEIVEGAILGDFKENPTIWNTIGQIAIGFVPYAGQVADVRDMVAAVNKLQKSGWKDPGAWFDLVLTGIGFIPGFGDIIKGIGRGAKSFLSKTLRGLLRNADNLLRPVLRRVKGMLIAAGRYGRRFLNWAKGLGPKLVQGVKRFAQRAAGFARSIGQRARRLVGRLQSRVGQLVRGAVNRAKGLMGRAKGFLSRAVGRFLGKAREVFGSVQRRLTGAVNTVRRLVQLGKEIAQRVKRQIAGVARRAANFLRESVQNAIRRGRAALTSARRWGAQQWQRAKVLGGRLVSGARRRVQDLIRRGVRWAKGKLLKWVKEKFKSIRDRVLNFLRKLWYKITRTRPSAKPDAHATPTGTRTTISPKDDKATIRSLQRENESADILSQSGYKVEQNPNVSGPKNPDYKIEGRIFDNYAPSTKNPRNIWSLLKKSKIDTGQADRIVLNLEDSAVDLKILKKQFNDWSMSGLKEVIVIKNGQVIPFWP